MEFKSSNPKANRILYIVVVAVLCVTAIIIGIVSAMNRSKTPVDTSDSVSSTSDTVTTTSRDNTVTTAPPIDVQSPIELAPTLIAPLAGSISKSHDITTPVFSVTMNDYRIHKGIDISASLGDAVVAAADGTIENIWADPMMGNCISISHKGGMVTIYKNLSENFGEDIVIGATVKSGDIIGAVGESAIIEIAEEPHLHFEVKVNGVYEDPLDYISDESRLTSLTEDKKFES